MKVCISMRLFIYLPILVNKVRTCGIVFRWWSVEKLRSESGLVMLKGAQVRNSPLGPLLAARSGSPRVHFDCQKWTWGPTFTVQGGPSRPVYVRKCESRMIMNGVSQLDAG